MRHPSPHDTTPATPSTLLGRKSLSATLWAIRGSYKHVSPCCPTIAQKSFLGRNPRPSTASWPADCSCIQDATFASRPPAAMELSSLFLLLSAVLFQVSSSPIAANQVQRAALAPRPSRRPGGIVKAIVTHTEENDLDLSPTPPPLGHIRPLLPVLECTTTVSETIDYPEVCFKWKGTLTVYPSATTQFRQVNCHGCDTIEVEREFFFCPNQVVNKTERVATPSTFWSTICSKSDTRAIATADGPMFKRTPIHEVPITAFWPTATPTADERDGDGLNDS